MFVLARGAVRAGALAELQLAQFEVLLEGPPFSFVGSRYSAAGRRPRRLSRNVRYLRTRSSSKIAMYACVVLMLAWPSRRATMWTGSPPTTASVANMRRKSCAV
jgi:hypothetical protein